MLRGANKLQRRLIFLICILLCAIYLNRYMQRNDLPYISLEPDSQQQANHRDSTEIPTIRVAIVGSASARHSFIFYRDFIDYLSQEAGLQVELILKDNYNIVNGLVCEGSVDLAFISSFSYALSESNCNYELLLRPIANNNTSYNSCIIVRSDSDIESLADLRGKTFAFTDPLSTLGRLYPLYLLTTAGETTQTFFKSVSYTYSTDYALHALANNLVDGAATNSFVLQSLNLSSTEFSSKFRVIHQSEPFPLNPLVINTALLPARRQKLQNILLAMDKDERGAAILHALGYSHFVEAKASDYEAIREMVNVVKEQLP